MAKENADLIKVQKAWDRLLGQILEMEIVLSKQRRVIEEATENIKNVTTAMQIVERLKHQPAVNLLS